MAAPNPTLILQDFFSARSRLRTAHVDLIAIANREQDLSAARFDNPPDRSLSDLAYRLLDQINVRLIRPAVTSGYPHIDDPVSPSLPLTRPKLTRPARLPLPARPANPGRRSPPRPPDVWPAGGPALSRFCRRYCGYCRQHYRSAG